MTSTTDLIEQIKNYPVEKRFGEDTLYVRIPWNAREEIIAALQPVDDEEVKEHIAWMNYLADGDIDSPLAAGARVMARLHNQNRLAERQLDEALDLAGYWINNSKEYLQALEGCPLSKQSYETWSTMGYKRVRSIRAMSTTGGVSDDA